MALATFALYCTAAFRTPGYDDEIYNISVVEQHDLIDTLRLTQAEDVHPPLSYLLNSVLYKALGDWRYVRLVSALLNALCICYFTVWLAHKQGWQAAALGFVTLALSPAMLMWTTSVRWYAYFLPVTTLLGTVPFRKRPPLYWGTLAAGLIGLGYTGYAVLFVGPGLVLWYVMNSPQPRARAWSYALLTSALALLAYLPQIPVFLATLARNTDAQVGSLFSSLVGVFVSVFSNQGVFPTSPFAWCGVVGWALLYALILQPAFQAKRPLAPSAPLVLTITLLVVAGVAAKFRNLVLVVPMQALSAASAAGTRHRRTLGLAAGLILLANLAGVVNVVRHEGTTKNSWNMPVAAVLAQLDAWSKRCGDHLLVFTHDPVLADKAARSAALGPVINYWAAPNAPAQSLPEVASCVVVVKTYRGAIPKPHYAQMINALQQLHFASQELVLLSPDSDAAFKRRLMDDVPDHLVELQLLTQVTGIRAMQPWFGTPVVSH